MLAALGHDREINILYLCLAKVNLQDGIDFVNRVRNFRGRVSYFNQSEARKHPFLASDWLKYETLPRKFRTLLLTIYFPGMIIGSNR